MSDSPTLSQGFALGWYVLAFQAGTRSVSTFYERIC